MSFQRYFSEQSHPPFLLKGISHTQNETGKSHLLHMHNFLELLFVFGGKGNLLANGTSFPLKKNDIIVINPQLKHTESSDQENPLEYFVISLQDIMITQVKNERQLIFPLKNTFTDITDPFFSSLLSSKNNGTVELLKANAFVYQILIRLLSENELSIQTSNSLSLSSTPPTNAIGIVNYLSTYIEQNYKQEINLDAISQHMNISKSYLIRIFKKEMGITPIAYSIEKRIEQAKYLLRNHSHPITHICFELGFASSAYFSKIFKAHTGMTPSQYRQNKKENNTLYLYKR